MTKLQEWLKELGLEQHAGVLADNDIDLDILPDLAESEVLGLSLGHRRKLLRALAALKPAPRQLEAPLNHTGNARSGTTPGQSVVFRPGWFDSAG
jgi:hypothetical protein